MHVAIADRLRSLWNAFSEADTTRGRTVYVNTGGGTSSRSPDRQRPRFSNERSIIASVYTRIGIDVASVPIRHVELDELGRYKKDKDSQLNYCLSVEPNLDQGPSALRLDLITMLFDKGVVALVPVETTANPAVTSDYDILSLRVGEICEWFPQHVRVRVYNEQTGKYQELALEKKNVAIIYNPFYSVMNEANSTLQRLIRKLTLLDAVDEQSSSGKLDLIIQLPYVIKSTARKEQAEQRRTDIELQLSGSKYGIAYADGTEKITQLNRPAENNLLKQVEYLTNLLYSELGVTPSIMDGTADEAAMINYYTRTVEPILTAIIEAEQRAFLGRLGYVRKQRIQYFRDPFKLVPLANIAEIADKFTRNEILSSNEIRGFMGIPPSADPKADQLINSNMPQSQFDPNADPTDSAYG